MADFLTTASTMMCPHGGTIIATTTNTRAQASGAYVVRSSDTFTVAGCPFSNGATASPCSQVVWATQSLKNAVGDHVLVQDSQGMCMGPSGTQGTALVDQTQTEGSGD